MLLSCLCYIIDLEEVMLRALARHEKEKEGNTFVMSKASSTAVRGLINNLELIVIDKDVPAEVVHAHVDTYDWQNRDEDDVEAFAGAFEFLKPCRISRACDSSVVVMRLSMLCN